MARAEQSEEVTLKELHRKMEQMQEERERDAESLMRQAGELYFASEREHKFKMELEVLSSLLCWTSLHRVSKCLLPAISR